MAPAQALHQRSPGPPAARPADPGTPATPTAPVSVPLAATAAAAAPETAPPAPAAVSTAVTAAEFEARPLTGSVIAITADRRRDELAALLEEFGARTLHTPTVRLAPGDETLARRAGDRAAAARFVGALVRRDVHAVTFTTAPGVTGLLEAAAVTGTLDLLLTALREDVLPVCLAPACARPLEAVGVTPWTAERPRFPALAELLAATLPQRIRREIRLDARRTLILQGFSVAVGEHCVTLPPLPAAVLAELARRPGWVVSRAELLRRVWDIRDGRGTQRDEHAVEATVARLRTALGPAASLIKTVTKRGYRLAVEP